MMPIDNILIPYDDFVLGTAIDPQHFDDNNSAYVAKINELIALINKYEGIVDGDSGADNVGLTLITDITGETVQSAMEGLKAYIDTADAVLLAQLQAVVLNQIPDGTITIDKLTTEFANSIESTNDDVALLNDKMLMIQKLQAYDIAMHDINDHISQPYSGMFYDLFVVGEPEKSLHTYEELIIEDCGDASIGALQITDLGGSSGEVTFGVALDLTVDDGFENEVILGTILGDVLSQDITTFPKEIIVQADGTLTLTLLGEFGHQGGHYTTGKTYPGEGGTVIGDLAVLSGDVLLIENTAKSSGGGGSYTGGQGGTALVFKKNDVVVAVAGGGGGSGATTSSSDSASSGRGGEGGGLIGENGTDNANALPGAGRGGTQTEGGIGGSPLGTATSTGGAGGYLYGGNGASGSGPDTYDNGGGGGGAGYYGGGGGGGSSYGSRSEGGGGGGGSSYVGGLTGSITNEQGTSLESEPKASIEGTVYISVPNGLVNEYKNPTVYRSNHTINTTDSDLKNNNINMHDCRAFDIRIMIENTIEDFDEIATWISASNGLTISEIAIAFGDSGVFSESVEVLDMQTPLIISSDLEEIRAEILNATAHSNAMLRFNIQDERVVQYDGSVLPSVATKPWTTTLNGGSEEIISKQLTVTGATSAIVENYRDITNIDTSEVQRLNWRFRKGNSSGFIYFEMSDGTSKVSLKFDSTLNKVQYYNSSDTYVDLATSIDFADITSNWVFEFSQATGLQLFKDEVQLGSTIAYATLSLSTDKKVEFKVEDEAIGVFDIIGYGEGLKPYVKTIIGVTS